MTSLKANSADSLWFFPRLSHSYRYQNSSNVSLLFMLPQPLWYSLERASGLFDRDAIFREFLETFREGFPFQTPFIGHPVFDPSNRETQHRFNNRLVVGVIEFIDQLFPVCQYPHLIAFADLPAWNCVWIKGCQLPVRRPQRFNHLFGYLQLPENRGALLACGQRISVDRRRVMNR